MNINMLTRSARPAKPGVLASLLLATVLNTPLGQTQAFPSESVDPSIHLPPNQAVQVTTEFLARNFANAFDTALNSPGDTLTLKIEGEVELPIPIPYVPPGIFNGGIQVTLTPEIKFVQKDGQTFYEVSLERVKGMSFGASIPDMPKGTDASGKVTNSVSTKEIFRFNSSTDAARGIMDIMLLHGLWQQMNKLEVIGIEINDVAGFSLAVRSYFADLTGIDFTLNRDDALKALNVAQVSLQLAEIGVSVASRSLDAAYKVLNAASSAHTIAQRVLVNAQRRVNTARARLNACRWYCMTQKVRFVTANAALGIARRAAGRTRAALNVANAGISAARGRLDQATGALDQASQIIEQAQRQLALLPEDASIDPFEIVLTRIVKGVEFLNQSQQGFEMAFSRGASFDAKASCLASVGSSKTRTLRIKINEPDKTVAVVINAATDSSAQAKLPGSAIVPGVEINVGTGIEYELVFAFNDQTQRFELEDEGTLKFGAGLKGIAAGGNQFCSSVFSYNVNVMAGVAVTPTLEFKPGQQMAEFGSNLKGAIDLTPLIEAVQGFPAIDPPSLVEAVTSTLESLDTDQLIEAIAQINLPVTITFNRIAGVRVNVNGGSDKVLKGGVKLSAVWSDYGDPVDLSDMTVGDFANRVLDGGEGLVDTADTVVTLTQEAFQQVDAMF